MCARLTYDPSPAPAPPHGPGDLLTTAQVARELGVTPQAVRHWISKGVRGRRLRATVTNRGKLVRGADLDRFLRGRTVARTFRTRIIDTPRAVVR